MNFKARLCVLGLAAVALAPNASSLGFGVVPGAAVLGLPVDLRIPVRLEAGEDIGPDCVSAQVLFGDTPVPAGSVGVKLEPAVPGATERMIRIQTITRVNEPVITIDLSAGCISRVSRSLTLFADPPLVASVVLAESVSVDPAVSAQQPPATVALPQPAAIAPPLPGPQSAVANSVSAGNRSTNAEAVAKPRQAPRPVKGKAPFASPAATSSLPTPVPSTVLAPTPRPASTVVPSAPDRAASVPPAAAKATAGSADSAVSTSSSRLKLATLEDGAAAVSAVSALPADTAASALLAASAAEAAATARAAELEAASQRLRAEVARTQQQINELSVKLKQVEEEREQPLIVYALGGLVLLLSGALWVLWRQREQGRNPSEWLVHAAPLNSSAASESETSVRGSETAALHAAAFSAAPALDDFAADSGLGDFAPLGGLRQPDISSAPLRGERRAVSVEELIDLEQQAEFFVVLGQDEAAVELLTSHLESSTEQSPLPYLKLLDIFKRRGARTEYEQLRERFNRRFAGHAPDWETGLQGGRSLEDYPSIVADLQSLWSSPQRALTVLQASLLRPALEGGSADPEHQTFDLPAYRELMMLYSVARDLSEANAGGLVDFSLPLDGGSSSTPAPFERLLATTPVAAQPSVAEPLTIDLSLDNVESWGLALPPITAPGSKSAP